ncbi:MAG: hypothetical protein AAGH64_07505 [Planctomycetota bacterium]
MSITKTAVAAALVLITSANSGAETLIIEIDSTITAEQIAIPEPYQDLYEAFGSNPSNGDFTLRIIIPEFERYQEGEHTVLLNVGNDVNYGDGRNAEPKINTPGLHVLLDTNVFGPLEGVWTRVPDVGWVIQPDETQVADVGEVTIVDGVVTELRYGWTEPDNAGIGSVNRYLTGRRGFPINIESLTIDEDTFSPVFRVGDVALVQGKSPEVSVKVVGAKNDDADTDQ